MNDLKFSFRQRSNNPGFTALAELTLESSDRSRDGSLSRSKSNHVPAVMRQRGNSDLHALTRHVCHFGVAPDGGLDERDRLETSDKRRGRLFECQPAVRGRAARNARCHAKSRVAIKFRVRHFRPSRRIPAAFFLGLIEQCAQSRSWTRIADHALPRGITVQLREQDRQRRGEFVPFLKRELLNCRLYFLNGAHNTIIPQNVTPSKGIQVYASNPSIDSTR